MLLKGSQFFWTQLAMMGQLAYHPTENGHHLSSTGREMRLIKLNDERLFFYILNGEVRSYQTRLTLNREYEGEKHDVAIDKVRLVLKK